MTIVTFEESTEVPVVIPPGHDPTAPQPSVRTFFGRMGVEGPGPQAFLASLYAPTTLRAHFHRIDQFQIFLSGPGCFYQRHELAPLVVHYADRYTTYGPFGTRQDVLQFFTLRASHSAFTGFMPEARDELIQPGGRNIHVEVDQDDTFPRGESEVESVMAAPDGLEALVVRAGPDTTVELPAANTELGEYHYVMRGTMAVGGRQVGQALGWYERGDAPASIVAGTSGVGLLVMRFPSSAR